MYPWEAPCVSLRWPTVLPTPVVCKVDVLLLPGNTSYHALPQVVVALSGVTSGNTSSERLSRTLHVLGDVV